IIAVSLSDLLEQNSEQRLAQARAIRERIQELHERFNIHFPVYLLFTKCDLLAGFMEYFDDLDREERSQVWGMTFKLGEQEKQNEIEQFKSEFGVLQEQLQNQLLDKLERERGGERRNRIYTFPQQFSSLNGLVAPFLEELFQSSRYAHEAMFRGVYFTSATQEGSPIDRIMGTLSNSFGLDHQSNPGLTGQGKSFFINSLLQKVIFAEAGLAGSNLKLEKKRQWFQQGAFIGVTVLTALMAFAWVTSYVRNKAYINDVSIQTAAIEAKINKINLDDIDPLSILPLLNEARAISGGYADQHDSIPLSLRFGLYQGDKLGDASMLLYRRLLKEVLLPRLMIGIEKQLQSNTNNTDYLYEALKVYLMLARAERYDARAIEAWYSLDWEYNLPLEVTTEQRDSLNLHLVALL
ncbi:MAG: type VI secretion system membrane subunit TssM, partial [Methylococcales bacterium]|nr:type VI secretion system membrane subunit TssM [Methylococcales bacterium]